MRTLVRGDYVRVERSCLEEAAQRAIDRGVPQRLEALFTQAPHNVITVAVLLGEYGKDRQVEYALQKL
jgi:hypothetical protein